MKKIIILILMVLMIPFAVADTCSFLDSDGDCVTTSFDASDTCNLALLKDINCYWSNCQYTLDVDGDGAVTTTDCALMLDISMLRSVAMEGVPSVIGIELLNDDTQIRITVTDADGTPRSDIGVNITVIEYPIIYDYAVYTDANGEFILDVPSELLTQSWTGRAWFDEDTQKQIPYTEATITYTYSPPPSDSPSGSSSGGGGGSTPDCEDKHFECTEWGECVGDSNPGTQTRTCENIRRCKGDYAPETSSSCYNWDYVKVQQAKESVDNALKGESNAVENEIKEAPKSTGAAISVTDSSAAKGFWKGIWNWFLSLFS